jgi:hypothetical protein
MRSGGSGSLLEYEEELEYEAPRGPAFRLACAGGCTVGGTALAAAGCRGVLRRDLARALGYTNRAAALLEAAPRAAQTRRLYLQVFGHRPERPVPWAPAYRDSGALSARRLRMAAHAIERRVIHFECRPQPALHPHANAAVPHTVGGQPNRTVIQLFPRYWTNGPAIRAGILVHETLHLIFLHLVVDTTARSRRVNAHCYEWLVLRLNGQTPDPSDLTQCRTSTP